MLDCIFCKIISGEIKAYKVYEDDFVLAFLDVHPCSNGHTVVTPKQHISSLLTLEVEGWTKMTLGLKKTIEKVKEVIKPDAMNIGINEGKASGQAVPHLHWHIIPRWENDGGGSMHSIIKSKDGLPIAEVAKLFLK